MANTSLSRMLERSWAKYFSENISPAIDEEPFRVLYSGIYLEVAI